MAEQATCRRCRGLKSVPAYRVIWSQRESMVGPHGLHQRQIDFQDFVADGGATDAGMPTGAIAGHMIECPDCRGRGRIAKGERT